MRRRSFRQTGAGGGTEGHGFTSNLRLRHRVAGQAGWFPRLHAGLPFVPAMSDERWVAIGTGLLALMTFVLAAITAWNVRKTSKLVEATEKSAAAAAATVVEIQRDRELAQQPYIDWSAKTGRGDVSGPAFGNASVSNIGRGLAIHCLCCVGWGIPQGASRVQITITTDVFDLAADNGKEMPMRERAGTQLTTEMAGAEIGEEPVGVAFCQDLLGNYYRFVPFKPSSDIYRPAIDKTEPRWMIFYRDQFSLLAKY
jgi:hypothetical protein